jgi:hypothetical protein
MIDINYELYTKISQYGDINEHLIYLSNLSRNCTSILECGVRSVISSWAFLNGLVKNKKDVKILHSCDIERSPNIEKLEQACNENNVSFVFHECDDLKVPVEKYDLIFIDTWHIYGHLKRELEKFHSMAQKYIVMHDTEIDKIQGETIRIGWNAEEQSRQTGIPVAEINRGLQPAIDEFLVSHPEWRVKEHFTHNNGLTVLERVNC